MPWTHCFVRHIIVAECKGFKQSETVDSHLWERKMPAIHPLLDCDARKGLSYDSSCDTRTNIPNVEFETHE